LHFSTYSKEMWSTGILYFFNNDFLLFRTSSYSIML
jgi:hypothetical protein